MVVRRLAFGLGFCLAVSGCGGDSGTAGGPSAPPLTVVPAPLPPTPSVAGALDKIIAAATTTQNFTSEGRSFFDGGLEFRYDAATGYTLATGNYDTTYQPLVRASGYTPLSGQPWLNFVRGKGPLFVLVRAAGDSPEPSNRYIFSNLAAWGEPLPSSFNGTTAFGIATIAGSGPSQGFLTYNGFLEGRTSETYLDEGQPNRGFVKANVALTFDPATNKATIALNLGVETDRSFTVPLGTIALSWAKGGDVFFQPVPGNPSSRAYPISGRFTGTNAEELIGSLTANYISPKDGSTQTINASFIAKS